MQLTPDVWVAYQTRHLFDQFDGSFRELAVKEMQPQIQFAQSEERTYICIISFYYPHGDIQEAKKKEQRKL